MRKPIRKVRTRAASVSAKARTSAKKSTKRKPSTNKAGFARGAEGFAQARKKREKQEAEYEKRKNTPFGFRLKPGDEAEVVILDTGDPFFVSLHKVKTGPNRWEDEVCIEDTGERCPICEDQGKSGSYTMVLTCLDRRPYTVQKGPNAGKRIKHSKKLLFVKGRNLPKFDRQFNGKAKGNFRGMKILCRRDGDKEAAMGEDLEFLGRVKESSLKKFGEHAEPADYRKIFEIPTAKQLRERYKLAGTNVAGSEEFEDGEDEEELDNVGWGE